MRIIQSSFIRVAMFAKARVAKEQYKDAWADGMTEWDALTPKERKVHGRHHTGLCARSHNTVSSVFGQIAESK